MISLREHGLLERAEVQITGDYTGQRLSAMYSAVTGAVVTEGYAAVEAVAGRVASMLSVARVEGGPRARQALTPTVLAMVGRNLIQVGESLHLVKVRPEAGEVYLCPAQHRWTVYGGADPEAWVIDATVTGAQTVYQMSAPRAAWLHVVRDADPDYPWRGVSPLERSSVTALLARAAEDALVAEMRQPVMSIIPMPQGASVDRDTLRSEIQARIHQVLLPPTTRAGFGGGMTSAPVTDWKVQRLQPMPTEALVKLSGEVQSRVVASLGCHPALIGGGGGNGSVDREAVRQFRKFVMQPIAALVAENAYRAFGERITLTWPASVDAMLVKARVAKELVGMQMEVPEALRIARLS